MKKGSLSLLIVLVLVVLLAVGCAPAATPTATAQATEAPTEVKTEEPTEAVSAMPTECETEGACHVIAAGDPIRIGHGGPMTGGAAAYGIDSCNGATLAAEQAGELFPGHAVEMACEDDLGTGDGGAAAANKLASDSTIVGIIGHNFSGASFAASPIYAEAMLPMISPSATNPGLTQEGSPVFNRINGHDIFQGELAARFMYDQGLRKIAILHDGEAYSLGLAERVQEVFPELGGEVVAFEAITPGLTSYADVLASISALEPDGVFYGGYNPEAQVLANERVNDPALADLLFVSGDGVYSSTFIEIAGDNTANWAITSAGVPAGSPEKDLFDAAFEARFGEPPGKLSSYSWYAFDAMAVMLTAVKTVGVQGDDGTLYIPKQALVDAVRHTSGFKGITGTFTCDETGECAEGGMAFFAVFEVGLVDGEPGFVQVDYKP